jgi:hypothetical protein
MKGTSDASDVSRAGIVGWMGVFVRSGVVVGVEVEGKLQPAMKTTRALKVMEWSSLGLCIRKPVRV